MAVQNLVEQHLVFITSAYKFDDNITNNANIVLIANNSVNKTYFAVTGGSFQLGGVAVAPQGAMLDLVFLITPAYQVTLQGNMPTIQAAFPNYTVVTYGANVAYGF